MALCDGTGGGLASGECSAKKPLDRPRWPKEFDDRIEHIAT